MKTHNDDKPFKCNNCNKEFRRKEDLKKHVYSCKKVVPNMQEENNKVLEPGIRLREEGIKGGSNETLDNLEQECGTYFQFFLRPLTVR